MTSVILKSQDLPELKGFVRAIWLTDRRDRTLTGAREISLPTGATHIAFRLSGEPLRIFDSESDQDGTAFGCDMVGGIRSRPVFKALNAPDFSIGAMLENGAENAVLGVQAGEIAGQHIAMRDLAGRIVDDVFERILKADDFHKVIIFREFLAARLKRGDAPHGLIAGALKSRRMTIDRLVKSSGYSHRYFVERFRRGVGLAPKEFFRVRRFNLALRLIRGTSHSLAEIAFRAGYADQAHLSREFREMSGVSPSAYRQVSPASAHHFRYKQCQEVRFLQDRPFEKG